MTDERFCGKVSYMKNEPMKNEPMKNEPMKNEPMKNEERPIWYLLKKGDAWMECVKTAKFSAFRKHAAKIYSFRDALNLAEAHECKVFKSWENSPSPKEVGVDFSRY